jgi:hypothetical protein
LDLVVANYFYNTVSVLLGNGDGTFQPAVPYSTRQYGYVWTVAVADMNGDGKPDLLAASTWHRDNGDSFGGVSVLRGNGDGTFQPANAYSTGNGEGMGVAAADVNGDGTPDLLVANLGSTYPWNSSVGVLLNLTTFTSTTSVTSSPNPSQVSQPVTLTAKVTSGGSIPNGSTVTFYIGRITKIGTGTTVDGVATLVTSFSKAGTYTVRASFAGKGDMKGSSGTVKQVVEK